MSTRILVLIGMLLPVVALAQEDERARDPDLFGATHSGYTNRATLGGPVGISADLKKENEVKEPYFRVPIRVFAPWYEWKANMNTRHGVQYGLNYQVVYLNASAGISDSSATTAASGILDIPITWTPFGKESGRPGTFNAKLESRHLFSDVAPAFLGFHTGSALLTGTKFNSFSIRFSEFYWRQAFRDGRIVLDVGKLDPTNYYTFYGLVHPLKNWYSYAFSTSPSINWPNQGMGIAGATMLGDNFFITAGLHDVFGEPYESGEILDFGSNFFDGKVMAVVEVGYVPSFEERYFKRVAVSYWHSDQVDDVEQGRGFAFSGHWFINQKWIPFLLAGFSDGKGVNTLAESIVSGGLGIRMKSHDILGLGLNWTIPPGADEAQYTVEAYYRFYLTEHLEFTPDVQLVLNPALNPNEDTVVYLGFRARATL